MSASVGPRREKSTELWYCIISRHQWLFIKSLKALLLIEGRIMTEGCCALCLFVPPREHWRLLCYFAQTAFGQSWHLNQAVYIDEAAPWHIVSLFSIEIDSFIESSLLLELFSVAYWSAGEWTHNKQLTAFRSDIGGASSDNYTLVQCCFGKIA